MRTYKGVLLVVLAGVLLVGCGTVGSRPRGSVVARRPMIADVRVGAMRNVAFAATNSTDLLKREADRIAADKVRADRAAKAVKIAEARQKLDAARQAYVAAVQEYVALVNSGVSVKPVVKPTATVKPVKPAVQIVKALTPEQQSRRQELIKKYAASKDTAERAALLKRIQAIVAK